jgi:hypothetical protein
MRPVAGFGNCPFNRLLSETLLLVKHMPWVGILVVFGSGPRRPPVDAADKKGSAGKGMPSTGVASAPYVHGQVHH